MVPNVVAKAVVPISNPRTSFTGREWTLLDDGTVTVYGISDGVHSRAYSGTIKWSVKQGQVWLWYSEPAGHSALAIAPLQEAYEQHIAKLVLDRSVDSEPGEGV